MNKGRTHGLQTTGGREVGEGRCGFWEELGGVSRHTHPYSLMLGEGNCPLTPC